VAVDADEVFAFLANLENHWQIADRFVEVVDLAGPPGARHGGRVRIRGPLGMRRTATTRVEFARPLQEMGGSARMSGGTLAYVRWLLRPADGHTLVTLGATIQRTTPFDRLLLRLGGLAWMQRRFEGTLRTLEDRLTVAPAAHT